MSEWRPKVVEPTRRAALLATAAVMGAFAFATPSIAAKWGPQNTVTVVDPSPVNWLSVTWNTMEEALRVDNEGKPQPTLAEGWKWLDDKTLQLNLRQGVVYQDGEKFSAKNLIQAFDKVQDWKNPHPPGSFLNFSREARMQAKGDYTVNFTFPKPDGAVFMKLRGMHTPSSAFWAKLGFVDPKTKTAEGHW